MEFIRQLLSGRIAKIIIFLLLASFAFWGVDLGFFGTRGNPAARVGEREISTTTLENRFRQRALEETQSGATAAGNIELRRRVLEGLVRNALIEEFVREQRLRVDDKSVKETIRGLPRFQDATGNFDPEIYRTSRRPGQEEQLRLSLALDLAQNTIFNTAFTLRAEVKQALRLQRQLRDVDYAILRPEDRMEGLQPAAGELEDYYRAHGDTYRSPERVRVSYLELDPETLPAHVTVEEEALRAFYENRREDYNREEKRGSVQVLVRLPPDSDEELREQARQRAEELLEEARNEERPLAELVETEPEAEERGFSVELTELGTRPQRRLPENLAEALFELEAPGAYSGVLEDSRGFLFLRLEDLEAGRESTFENSRDDAEQNYRELRADQLQEELLDQLQELSYQHQDELRTVAEFLEWPLHESGWFSRDSAAEPAPGEAEPRTGTSEQESGDDSIDISDLPQVRAAAFTPELLREGGNSPLLELEDGKVLVLRILEHEAAAPRLLEEVRDQVREDWTRARAEEEVRESGEQLLQGLRAGADPELLAEQEKFSWRRREGLQRDDSEAPRSVLRRVFALPRPEQSTTIFDGYRRGNGSYVLLALHRVAPEDEIEVTPRDLRQATPLLESLSAVHDWNELLAALKKTIRVEYYDPGILPGAPQLPTP